MSAEDEKARLFAERFNPADKVYLEKISGMYSLFVEGIPLAKDTSQFFYGKENSNSSIYLVDNQLSTYSIFSLADGEKMENNYVASKGTIPYAGIHSPMPYEKWLNFHYREHNDYLTKGIVFGFGSEIMSREYKPAEYALSRNSTFHKAENVSNQLDALLIMFSQMTKIIDEPSLPAFRRAISRIRAYSEKPILIIQSHGDSGKIKDDKWWDLGEQDEYVNLLGNNSLLRSSTNNFACVSNINYFLDAVDKKYGDDFFSLIIVTACNPGKVTLRTVNTPILYCKGLVGIRHQPDLRVSRR